MSEQVRYITNEQGERVGVLLNLEVYERMVSPLALDADCLVGLSVDELQALASCKLSPAEQVRLDDLLSRNAESRLAVNELAELDRQLASSDHLTVLKARARYTLQRLDELARAA